MCLIISSFPHSVSSFPSRTHHRSFRFLHAYTLNSQVDPSLAILAHCELLRALSKVRFHTHPSSISYHTHIRNPFPDSPSPQLHHIPSGLPSMFRPSFHPVKPTHHNQAMIKYNSTKHPVPPSIFPLGKNPNIPNCPSHPPLIRKEKLKKNSRLLAAQRTYANAETRKTNECWLMNRIDDGCCAVIPNPLTLLCRWFSDVLSGTGQER